MKGKRFLLFPNHLRLLYSIPKSFALILNIHTRRHTFATWALKKGVRIEVVSKMLAHTNINTTQIYAKVLQEEVTKGFELLK